MHQGDKEMDEQRLSPWDGREEQPMLAEECRASGAGVCKVCGSAAWAFVKEGVHCYRCFSFQSREGYPSLRTPQALLPSPTKRPRTTRGSDSPVLPAKTNPRPAKEQTPENLVDDARVMAAVARVKPRLDLLEPHEYPGPVPDINTTAMFNDEMDNDLLAFLSMKLDLKPITIDNLKVLSKKAEAWIDQNRPYWQYAKRNRMLKATVGAIALSRKESTYGLLEKMMLERKVSKWGIPMNSLVRTTLAKQVEGDFVGASRVRNHIVAGQVPTIVLRKELLPSLILGVGTIFTIMTGRVKATLGLASAGYCYTRYLTYLKGWNCLFDLNWENGIPQSI